MLYLKHRCGRKSQPHGSLATLIPRAGALMRPRNETICASLYFCEEGKSFVEFYVTCFTLMCVEAGGLQPLCFIYMYHSLLYVSMVETHYCLVLQVK